MEVDRDKLEGIKDVEKRLNKFFYFAISIGILGLILSQSFWGLILGLFIGIALSNILHNTMAGKAMKAKIRDYNEYQKEQKREQRRMDLKEKESLNIKCPTCGSSHVNRITTGKKLAYVATFGILAPAFKKVRSQFQCRKCNYKW